MDKNGEKSVNFGSGVSPDLGPLAERELLNWIEDLCMMGYPTEWGQVQTAAVSIARAQGNPLPPFFFFLFFFCSSYS